MIAVDYEASPLEPIIVRFGAGSDGVETRYSESNFEDKFQLLSGR